MALKGDLKSLNLANVLQDLSQNEQTGTLKLEAGERHRYLWFEKGALRLVGLGGGRGPSLLNGLLATGKISLADSGAAAKKVAEVALVRALLKRGTVTREAVKAGLEQQMMELVCDAFLWSDATFEFVEGDPADEHYETSQLDHEGRLACDAIIMEALRRADEWAQIKKSVLSTQEIHVPQGGAAPAVDAITGRVLSLVDGERRLQDIIDETHLGQFDVFKAAAALKAAGAIRPLTTPESLDRTQARLAQRQFDAALRLARFGLDREPHHQDLRRAAAAALEGLDRRDEAAAEYRVLVSSQVETGQGEAAMETCRRILALAPRDTFTQERLFQLLLDAGRKEEAIAQGEALAGAFKRVGLPDKAKEVYTRLMSQLGDSDDLLEAAAEVARHLGDKKEAIQIYRKLFDRALAKNDEEQVLQLSRTLLRLDPGLEDIARKRMEIETGAHRKRLEVRRRARTAAILGIVVVLVSAAGVYEFLARSEYGALHTDSIELNSKGEYARILERYDHLTEGWPLSLVQRTARAERDKVEELFAKQQASIATRLEEAMRLVEAIGAVERMRKLCRLPENVTRAESRMADLVRRRAAEENKYLELVLGLAKSARLDGNEESLKKLAAISHPLAVPALREGFKDESPAVRRAVAAALRTMEGDESLQLLVQALASDADETVRGAARQSLTERTGERFQTAREWDEWLRQKVSETSPQPALQALLTAASEAAAAGAPIPVRWELINVGRTPAEFTLARDFGPLFGGTGPGGPVTMKAARPPGEERVIRLRPGEFIGGSADLAALCQGIEAAGPYRLTWSGSVKWGGGGAAQLQSLPLTLQLSKP